MVIQVLRLASSEIAGTITATTSAYSVKREAAIQMIVEAMLDAGTAEIDYRTKKMDN